LRSDTLPQDNATIIKSELIFPPQIIDQIAERVIQKMMPLLQEWRDPDLYLNVGELSAMLGKSQGQIYQWVNQAQHGLSDFPYQKAGRSLRFSKRDIQKWMKGRKNG